MALRDAVRRPLVVLAAAALAAPALAGTAQAVTPTVLFVAKANTSCSDSGPGTGTVPFCTINKGLAAVVAGQTVQVAAGTYNEAVTVPKSGTADAPITLSAAPGVVVTSTGIGINVPGRSWVVVRGFEVGPTTNEGIRVSGASSNVTIMGNHVHHAGSPVKGSTENGIAVRGSTVDTTIVGNTVESNSDSGIFVSDTSTRVLVERNETFRNARVYTRAAPGIDIRSNGNTVRGNYSHHNEDSGVQLRGGCTNNLVVGNRTDHNEDHGIDILDCTNTVVTGNSVYKNVTAGINDEGASPGVTIKNNIAVDNGINSPRTSGNIRVDKNSFTGSIVDSNLTYLSTPSTNYVWNSTSYSSLAAFQAAVGQEAHGIQADPKWRNAEAGDLHLTAGSPAIDSADAAAGGHPAVDYDGLARVDDPTVADTGIGARSFDDRGAYEYQPSDFAPVAALTVTPATGAPPLAVTADASASTDADATPIASYRFNFGDGSGLGAAQTGATATHTYTTAGTYTVSVTVTDSGGLSATKTATVVMDAPPTAALTVTPASGTAPLAVTADARASSDGDGTPIASYHFNFGDGTTTGPQTGGTADHTFAAAGAYTVTVTVTDTAGHIGTASATVSVSRADFAPLAALTVTPSTGSAPLAVLADASGSTDTDATPITSYSFDFGDGSAATAESSSATAPHTYTTPGTYTAKVTVKDGANLSSTATATVTVADGPPAVAMTVTPTTGEGSVAAPLVVNVDATGSTDADGTPIATYLFDFGDGSAVIGPQAQGTMSHQYATPGSHTLRVTVTDTANLSSTKTQEIVVLAPNAAPVAGLAATPASGTAPLLVTLDAGSSTDTDHKPVKEYRFAFGDGTPVTAAQPGATTTHTYARAGSYTAEVTVTDTGGLSSTASVRIEVAAPNSPPTATLVLTSGAGSSITADASGSTDADASPIGSYDFAFGDGASTGTQPGATANHTYTATGTYTVTVTVTDTAGLSSTATATISVSTDDEAPDAVLAVTLAPPRTVTADASGSTDGDATPIKSYGFNFGDGFTAVQGEPTLTHTYAAAGTYTITLTVTDTAGLLSEATSTVTVGAGDLPPIATLALTPTSGTAPLTVTADASGSSDPDGGPIADYSINFGDGGVPSTGPTTSHTYTTPGTYTVTLTVSDAGGATSEATGTVVVHPDAPPAAVLAVSPSSGEAPLVVTADGSGSSDTDGTPIASYAFDFGDGTTIPAQANPTVSHTYTAAGNRTVTMTVTDTAGLRSTATSTVVVKANT
ncbi:MAG: Carbohydrate-binding and sugar hydrolysis, partial [Frankiales bacterium]|nr:Carbohydrate-binding and sugar hydrolysis [Frankiales bacterium]